MIGLTAKQRELYQFIAATIAETGVAPSFDEMAAAVGLRAKSRIHVLLSDLERRGMIHRVHRGKRAIDLVERGDAVALHPEVRAAAVAFAKREDISLSTALAIAARAYFIGDKAA